MFGTRPRSPEIWIYPDSAGLNVMFLEDGQAVDLGVIYRNALIAQP